MSRRAASRIQLRRHRFGAACAAVAALSVAGCGARTAPADVAGGSTTPSPSSTAQASPRAVAPPTSGDVDRTVAARRAPAPTTAGLTDRTRVGDLQVQVLSRSTTTVSGAVPGEGGGPAVVLRLRVTNLGGASYDTIRFEPTLTDARGDAATRYPGPPSTALPTTLPAGQRADVTLVFLVPKDAGGQVSLSISTQPGAGAAVLRG